MSRAAGLFKDHHEFQQPWASQRAARLAGNACRYARRALLTPNDAAQGRLKKDPELGH